MALYTPNPLPPPGWTEAIGGLTSDQLDETLKGLPFHTAAFAVRRSVGSAGSLGNGVWTKVDATTLDGVVADSHLGWSAANARYTIPTGMAGIWFVSGLITLSTASDGSKLIAGVYKNGALVGLLGRGTVGGTDTAGFGGSLMLNLAVGDYIELWGFTNSTSLTMSSTTGYTHFEGFRLL